jgi:hypothetical protein
VSGSAIKTPRKMYWTEGSFRPTGYPVAVPSTRVGAVNVRFTAGFPERVSQAYVNIGDSQPVTTNMYQELRTLWWDSQQGLLLAYNLEGRVFVELLGDSTGPNVRQHLGFEIVDVFKQPTPVDLTVELGDKITAYADGRDDSALQPKPVVRSGASPFLYQDPASTPDRADYFAVRETVNQNDVLVHWLEPGVAGLRWPLLFDRYREVWPADLSRYSHYVRPPAATDAEAQLTAVPLPSENAPAIQYQDALDQERGRLTSKYAYYSWLDAGHPLHRALLRLSSGARVSFERVYSILNSQLARPVQGSGPVDVSSSGASTTVSSRNSFLNLGGGGAYGQLPPDVYFTGTNGFTVEAWVYVRSVQYWSRLFDFGNPFGADAGNEVLLALSYGNFGVVTYNASRGLVGGSPVAWAPALPLNQWVHLAFVQQPSSNTTTAPIALFLNGVKQTQAYMNSALQSQPAGVVPNAVTRNLCYIGRSLYPTDAFADAAFDDFRIWSGPRSEADIRQGMTNNYPAGTTGLTVQLGFEDAGPVAYDSSGNGRHMQLLGGAVIATDPTANAGAGGLASLGKLKAPRYLQQTVYVGDRISAPDGELGSGAGEVYRAGYVLQRAGDSFHATAYVDPFAKGFEAAGKGAIIPVNAIPGRDKLEIWWYRRDATNAVQNEANGFKPIYWPSVVGRYTILWPDNPTNQIVLASNAGSGPLDSFQAVGKIYTQNDPAAAGYNPNEEHALMLGGQAYALRDDLNVTSGPSFSSQPYVLLDYTAADGRPAIRPFKVLREKPEAGILFDYIVEAGAPLQPPMPLPFLPPPVELLTNNSAGTPVVYSTNYNKEPSSGGDLPGGWAASGPNDPFSHYASFTFEDRKHSFWVMRGPHAGPPPLQAGRYDPATGTFSSSVVVVAQPFTPFINYIHTSRPTKSLVATVVGTPLPFGSAFGSLTNGLAVFGLAPAVSGTYTLAVTDGDGSVAFVTLSLQISLSANPKVQGPFQLRPTNSFSMRFYYKTQEGFAWPGLSNPPEIGAIVPYLRPVGSSSPSGAKTTPSLDIIYRPIWPGNTPAMAFGQTLTVPKQGLPAMRGQSSIQVLYQQSIATNLVVRNPAVVLHDPTREKSFALLAADAPIGLTKVPAGVRTEMYQGKAFFPSLPPHLIKRFFFDRNRGDNGSLVLRGEFQDELVGEKYLLLNVLAGSDLASVQGLCPGTDADKRNWDDAVAHLSTTVETFQEDPPGSGLYLANTNWTVARGVGELTAITNANTAVDSYALSASGPGKGYVTVIVGNGSDPAHAAEPVSMYVLRVAGKLYTGQVKVIAPDNPLSEMITFQHTADLAGQFQDYEYQWKIGPPVDGFPPVSDATMSRYQDLVSGRDRTRYTLGGSGIQTLVDNYVVLRYRPMNPSHPFYSPAPAATATNWSDWTAPALAEGWIKRVLAGINPFGQRVTDLFNNTVNTDVSLLTQAGRRYEGDIALNLSSINNYGLIEIYETVLKRGRLLSIDAGINFGPANDALLLAAGYLNDLYMLVGNEAYADAANPTISIGTKDNQYGSIATALFAFRGQEPTLLEEELALMRGRDDVALPGVQIPPVYNRLYWNYTRGIDAGEVIYALNYNILDQNHDGKVNAADAAVLYPMGHGDAYGHYLTALKGYYSLLMNPSFDWVPRIEAVNVLGVPVTVDYLDERKFVAAAAAVARSGRQIFDLTWRRDYVPGKTLGWDRFGATRVSSRTVLNGTQNQAIVRYWGSDHWATRTGQGALLNWVVGNSLLPDVDPNPSHEGVQKIDRTTVPELRELAATVQDLQAALDNAEGRLTPLGLTEGAIPFDLDPTASVASTITPHFEQIYGRATAALNNAVAAFDDAKDVTRLMRSEEDSLADLRASINEQELAFTNALIEVYGTPYPDDVGPGKTYVQGYAGPDLVHYMYVENPELTFGRSYNPIAAQTFRIDIQQFPADWVHGGDGGFGFLQLNSDRGANNYVTYNLSADGDFRKPASWRGSRQSPGEVQGAMLEVIRANNELRQTLISAENLKTRFDAAVRVYNATHAAHIAINALEAVAGEAELVASSVEKVDELWVTSYEGMKEEINKTEEVTAEALPKSTVFGLANGGDVTSPARAAFKITEAAALGLVNAAIIAKKTTATFLSIATATLTTQIESVAIPVLEASIENRQALYELDQMLLEVQEKAGEINQALINRSDAREKLAALIAKGDRLQAEREVSRRRSSAIVQGFRTRDAAFRIFRNEKLERYKTLFDLAARYAFMAANAYDYDTGLLNTDAGRSFVNRIVSSRALGVVADGEPQFAGSNTGDPGLSSALAEMKADWDVLQGRLGFNNPDDYQTLASLRSQNLQLVPHGNSSVAAEAGSKWQDYLQQCRMDNLLDDADIRRYCLQIDAGAGLPVPGFVLTFGTTVTPGLNLFGKPLGPGDSQFYRSSFANKIHSVGVVFEGYVGMKSFDGSAPADPDLAYLNPLALSATPYLYLIPVGVDSMRTPPLGDTSDVRTWRVDDVAVPLPFNLGASGFSGKPFYQSADSLTEPLFTIRKHQAFRAVPNVMTFNANSNIGGSQFYLSSRRLIGRSVWNSQWKLVIPADGLLADPKDGMRRFIQSVTDIQLFLTTYSYSGN